MTHQFEIERLAVALGNRDHHGAYALAEATVRIAAFEVSAFLDPHGIVNLPRTLRDEALAAQVATEFRRLVLLELDRKWTATTKKEAQRLLKQAERRAGA